MTSIRLRQVALVTHDLGATAAQVQEQLGLGVEPFRDPIVGDFGLENRVFEAGDCFLEILTPIRPDTAGGRYLERRGGDAAYMAMFQVDDLAPAQKRVADLGIRIVWQGGHPDIVGMHLHPQDVPGAIVSFEWADPADAWRWAGPRWTGAAPADASAGGLQALTVGAVDPPAMAARWAEVLDLPVEAGHTTLDLAASGQQLRFVPVTDRRAEGISEVALTLPCDSPFRTEIAGTTFVVSPDMTEIARLLAANEGYAATRANVGDARPSRHLAVVTCMDARIDVFAALGLNLGEAHVIRNAGGRVTSDVLRSLALSSGVLGVNTVVVMQHTKCGLAGVSDEELQAITGADLGFFPIDDHAAALREDIDTLAATPYLSRIGVIAGFVYDVETGEIDHVVRWNRGD